MLCLRFQGRVQKQYREASAQSARNRRPKQRDGAHFVDDQIRQHISTQRGAQRQKRDCEPQAL